MRKFSKHQALKPTMRSALFAAVLALGVLLVPAAHADPATRSCGQVLLPMADGVRLHGWVNREEPMVARPVLLTISSYQNSNCPGGGSYYVSPTVANRMTMVFINMRGSGASEGTYDLFGPNTQSDIHAVIGWITRQPWSNGRIVLAGSSGNGLFMMDALKEPAVKAAVAETTCADLYECFHRGGANAQQVAGVYFANMMQGYEAGAQLRLQNGTAANPSPAQQLAAFPEVEAQALQHPLRDQFWKQRSVLDELARLDKPVMYTSSNYDLLDPTSQWSEARHAWVNLGLSHSVWSDYVGLSHSPQAYQDVIWNQLNEFVAHFGLGDGPVPPRVALMIGDGGFPAWEKQHAYLRTDRRWPLPDTRWTDLHLSAARSGSATSLNDGTLSSRTTADAGDTVPLVSSPGIGQDLRVAMLGPALVRADAGYEVVDATSPLWDLRREEAAGLTFTTPVLQHNLEVSGPILAHLWASARATDFTWAVRLTDVAPDGSSQWITDGYLRASMRGFDARRSLKVDGRLVRPWRDYDASDPVVAGDPTEYVVALQDASNVFRAGHRLRFDILPVAGAGYDTADVPGAGVLTLLHDQAHPSRLQIPVIPGRCQHAVPMTPGDPPLEPCARSFAAAAR